MGIGGVESTLEQLWELLPEEVTVPVVAVTALALAVGAAVVVGCRRQPPVLEARVLSLHVRNTLPLSVDHGQSEAVGPHWSDAAPNVAVPVAIAIGTTLTVDVRVDITRSERCPATTRLRGSGANLDFTVDDCPTAVGVHQVTVTIANARDRLTRELGAIDWSLALGDGTVGIGRTRHHLFFLFRDSRRRRDGHSAYKAGVWLEILEHIFAHAGIGGQRTEAEAASAITTYCHAHGPEYASVGHYELDVQPSQGYPAKLFRLQDYLDRRLPRVNCADQAQAVTALCHALGVRMAIVAFDPFGYIRPTRIVGIVGDCNNPKPSNGAGQQLDHHVTRPDDQLSNLRWGFYRHVLCVLGSLEETGQRVQIGMGSYPGYRLSGGSSLYDACAGPRLGMSIDDYLRESVDTETHEMRSIARQLRKLRGESERAPEDFARAERIQPEMEISGLRVACPVCAGDDLTEVSRRYIDYQNLDETTFRCSCGERFTIGETRK